MLFAVNAGDSSFSVLTVSKHDCTVLKPIARPIAIPRGDFPVAITYSDELKTGKCIIPNLFLPVLSTCVNCFLTASSFT